MNRRSFLTWVGVGWVASSLPIAIAACSPTQQQPPTAGTTPPAGGAVSSGGFKEVGTATELKEKGQLLNKTDTKNPVLVVQNPDAAGQLVAVNPTCNHKGCFVEWKANQKQFSCPCHDSDFAVDGRLLKGPATQALSTYEAKIEGDKIVVKLS
jgi:cytochrome b6-f complex iron-sulfur subunit